MGFIVVEVGSNGWVHDGRGRFQLFGFLFDFLWVSVHGDGWYVIAVVVSLVMVAKVGLSCVDFCFDFCVDFYAWWW